MLAIFVVCLAFAVSGTVTRDLCKVLDKASKETFIEDYPTIFDKNIAQSLKACFFNKNRSMKSRLNIDD